MKVTAAGSSPPPRVAPSERVVVVGAGPAGMATAIELAQRGVPSVVLEKRGMVATRQPVFNVVPAFADRLAALDDGDGTLTNLLTPIERMDSVHLATGSTRSREFDGDFAPDATRSRGDMGALLRGSGPPESPGADRRPWAMVGIDQVENGMRRLATTRYKDLIDLRTDTGVASIAQGDGWVEARLEPATDGSVRDAVRGAFLVDASGRDLLGGPRTTYPETAYFVGARYPVAADGRHAMRKVRDEHDNQRSATVMLPARDRTIVWTQLARPAAEHDDAELRSLLADRARAVGVEDVLAADEPLMPVQVQLWTSDEPATGRVLKVGDSVRAPYFMTSTGAASAIVHDAPRAVDAIMAAREDGDVAGAVGAYADAVRAANLALVDQVRPQLASDTAAATT